MSDEDVFWYLELDHSGVRWWQWTRHLKIGRFYATLSPGTKTLQVHFGRAFSWSFGSVWDEDHRVVGWHWSTTAGPWAISGDLTRWGWWRRLRPLRRYR